MKELFIFIGLPCSKYSSIKPFLDKGYVETACVERVDDLCKEGKNIILNLEPSKMYNNDNFCDYIKQEYPEYHIEAIHYFETSLDKMVLVNRCLGMPYNSHELILKQLKLDEMHYD